MRWLLWRDETKGFEIDERRALGIHATSIKGTNDQEHINVGNQLCAHVAPSAAGLVFPISSPCHVLNCSEGTRERQRRYRKLRVDSTGNWQSAILNRLVRLQALCYRPRTSLNYQTSTPPKPSPHVAPDTKSKSLIRFNTLAHRKTINKNNCNIYNQLYK